MKHNIFSIAVMATTLFFSSCKKQHENPVVQQQQTEVSSAPSNKEEAFDLTQYPNAYFDTTTKTIIKEGEANFRSTNPICYLKNETLKQLCYGHTWKFTYYQGDTDVPFVIPNLIGGIDSVTGQLIPNTAIWAANGSVEEFTYKGVSFNTGTLIIDSCGGGFRINTLFLTDIWFTFSEIKVTVKLINNKLKITKVTFKGKVQEGTAGLPFRVRIEGLRVEI